MTGNLTHSKYLTSTFLHSLLMVMWSTQTRSTKEYKSSPVVVLTITRPVFIIGIISRKHKGVTFNLLSRSQKSTLKAVADLSKPTSDRASAGWHPAVRQLGKQQTRLA